MNDTDNVGDITVSLNANVLNITGSSATPTINFQANGGGTTIVTMQADGLHNVAKIVFGDGTTQTTAGVGGASSVSSITDAVITGDSDVNGSGTIKLVIGATTKLQVLNSGNVAVGQSTADTTIDVVSTGGITLGGGLLTIDSIAGDYYLSSNFKQSNARLKDTSKGSWQFHYAPSPTDNLTVEYAVATAGAPSYNALLEFNPSGLIVDFPIEFSAAATFDVTPTFANMTVSGTAFVNNTNETGSTTWNADGTVQVTAGHAARAYKNANQSIANNTLTALTFDSEDYDPIGYHSTSSNTDRVVAPIAGTYLVVAQVNWASATGGVRDAEIDWTHHLSSTSNQVAKVHLPATVMTAPDTIFQNLSAIVHVVASDYVQVFVKQTSGSGLNVVGGAANGFGNATTVSMSYMGP
jgi:hypothetical protein